MSNAEQLDRIEVSLEEAKRLIELKNAIVNLSNNKDFDLIIHNNYFEKESQRLVMLKCDPSFQTEEGRKGIDVSMYGISALRRYFQLIIQQGELAERAMIDDENTREELLHESFTGVEMNG